jgi:hypothetical protein
MRRSVAALLQDTIDYAGTFPPASLTLDQAARNYGCYRRGAHASLLGALVVSARQLPALRLDGTGDQPWPINVVLPADSELDVDSCLGVSATWGRNAALTAFELPPLDAAHIESAAARVPRGVDVFVEVPIRGATDAFDVVIERRLDAVAAAGAWAKFRTGGVAADAFPSAAAIYRFLRACAARNLACKATAGLHHARSGSYPLTYAVGSPVAPMFGFLNVCVLAALVHADAAERDALEVLGETAPLEFRFDDDALLWRGHRIPAPSLADMRRTLFRSFGSCSFQEPVEDLERLGLV